MGSVWSSRAHLSEVSWKALFVFNDMSEAGLDSEIDGEVGQSFGYPLAHVATLEIDDFLVHRPFGLALE